MLGLVEQFRRRAALHHPAVMHHHHGVGEGQRLGLVVGDVDHRHAELLLLEDHRSPCAAQGRWVDPRLERHPVAQVEVGGIGDRAPAVPGAVAGVAARLVFSYVALRVWLSGRSQLRTSGSWYISIAGGGSALLPSRGCR